MTIRVTDLFIADRNSKNYKLKAQQIRDYLPPLNDPVAMVFFQETAPMYWTQVTDGALNDATLRVVNTAGGGTGGSATFDNVFKEHTTKVKKHSHGTGGGSHTHSASGGSHKHGVNAGSHTHSLSGGGISHNHVARGFGGVGRNTPARHSDKWGVNESRTDNFSSVSLAVSVNGGKAGVSSKASTNDSVSFANASVGSLSVTNTTANSGESVGTKIDFRIKYSKSIICKKNPLT